MDPVSASVGLAASLVTVIELTTKCFKTLSKFSRGVKNAPDNIRKLCGNLQALEQSLSHIQSFERQLTDKDVDPLLRASWQKCMIEMAAVLRCLEGRAVRLNTLLEQGGHFSRMRATLKHFFSAEETSKYERLLEGHVRSLVLIQGHHNSRQLHQANAMLQSIAGELAAISTSPKETRPSWRHQLEHSVASLEPLFVSRLNSVDNALHRLKCRSTQMQVTKPERTASALVERERCLSRRRNASPQQWRLSIFNFPVGILTVERYSTTNEKAQIESLGSSATTFHVFFRFKPKLWISDGIYGVIHSVSTHDQSLPVWQRIQRRVPSLVPQAVLDVFWDMDPFKLRSILPSTPVAALDLLRNQRLPNASIRALYCSYSSQGLSSLHLDFESRLEGAHNKFLLRWDSKFKVPVISTIGRNFPFLSWNTIDFIFDRLVGRLDEQPRLLLTTGSFDFFATHICPHLDCQALEELPKVERWWLATLNHEDSRFGAAIKSHNHGFRSSFARQKENAAPIKDTYADFKSIVQEILEAPETQRHDYLVLLCVLGTAKSLRPFLDAKYDFNHSLSNKAFLYGEPTWAYIEMAAFARNFSVVEALAASGVEFTPRHLQRTLRRESPSLSNIESDKRLLYLTKCTRPEQLISKISPVHMYCTMMDWMSEYTGEQRMRRAPFCREAHVFLQELLSRGWGWYCYPPYHRTLFLGSELICCVVNRSVVGYIGARKLLSLGASGDYVGPSALPEQQQRTVLKWAVEFGRIGIILELVLARQNFEHYEACLRAALHRANECLRQEHPRSLDIPLPDLQFQASRACGPHTAWEAEEWTLNQRRGTIPEVIDVLSCRILETTLSAEDDGRKKAATALDYVWNTTRPFGIHYEYKDMVIEPTAKAFGVDLETPSDAPFRKPSRFQGRLQRLSWHVRMQIHHFRDAFESSTCTELALGIVGLVLCLQAILEHQVYEFVIWLWLQRHSLKAFLPPISLSIGIHLISNIN